MTRRTYVILLVITVGVGLAIHFHATGLPAPARDILGDALWAVMIFWLASLVAPKSNVLSRAAAALAICFAVELGQQIEHPALQSIRGSTFGHLVLGSDFDVRDLGAYTAGIAAAVVINAFASRST